LNDHVETIYISCREGEEVETFELTVPDCVGFLMLKTAVCKFRENPKDSYDIYYYCRYSEEPSVIRQRLAQFAVEPAVGATINSLKTNFSHEDSKWVEMVLDHMEITDANDRDQEARLIVRTIGQVIPLLP
jgi:hypothetical protein